MGQGAHAGHSAAARQRIGAAREHYETRRERRPIQIWRHPQTEEVVTGKGCEGAIPDKHSMPPRRNF